MMEGSMMRAARGFLVGVAALLAGSGTLFGQTVPKPCGNLWDSASRSRYYSLDQGSRMIPLAWAGQLKQRDGRPFMADSLSRYGFLPNEFDLSLPVGFTAATAPDAVRWLGMTCAACHTRAVEVDGRRCIVDGGPAFADFQRFAVDLDAAVAAILPGEPGFRPFANAILGAGASTQELSLFAFRVKDWYDKFHLWISSMPPAYAQPWGPARMDAVGLIFNRLIGLDLGLSPSRAAANVLPAYAAVRYPFLWNAPKQDWTQWGRFAQNGDDLHGLLRNLGQVYGVFAKFAPTIRAGRVDYITGNSANFDGLQALETLVRAIPAPRFDDLWPAGRANAIDRALAHNGEQVFNRPTSNGGCVACHGEVRLPTVPVTWKTGPDPLEESKTDTDRLALINLGRGADSGVLEGQSVGSAPPLKKQDTALRILTVAAGGSYADHQQHSGPRALAANPASAVQVKKAAQDQMAAVVAAPMVYEARVLYGVWAAAPYLHNGSVPTLADLLLPGEQRPSSFKIGPKYDPKKVGLAVDQDGSAFTLQTTGCSDRTSGVSRCGHEYGTQLDANDKAALLEYLKTL